MPRFRRVVLLLCTLSVSLRAGFYDDMVGSDEKKLVARVEDKAVVVVIRKMLPGAAVSHNVYLNDRFIGKTLGYTWFYTVCDTGTQYFITRRTDPGRAARHGTTRLHLKAGKVYFLRHVVTGPTSVLAPISPEDFKDMREDTKYTELRQGVTADLGASLDSLGTDYLRSLEEDPKRHRDNEGYEGY